MLHDPFALVGEYHRNLPDRIIDYLHARGISDEIIALHRLGWNGQRITIPVFDREGGLAFFKFAKDPEDQTDSPKMLTSRGGSVELYGWERVLAKPSRLIICEGEFDRLVLESQGIAAVTSTGGAGSFHTAWVPDLESIPELYLCFDRDHAGRHGARRVGQLVPHAKIVELPEEVGPGGDVTDFFVRLERTRHDFENLLRAARAVPRPPESLPVVPSPGWVQPFREFRLRVTALKAATPIAEVIGQYVALRVAGRILRGLCPFHDDHSPSLAVYPESGTFHCFGCGQHGDVITFLMMIAKLTFTEALHVLEELSTQHNHGAPRDHP